MGLPAPLGDAPGGAASVVTLQQLAGQLPVLAEASRASAAAAATLSASALLPLPAPARGAGATSPPGSPAAAKHAAQTATARGVALAAAAAVKPLPDAGAGFAAMEAHASVVHEGQGSVALLHAGGDLVAAHVVGSLRPLDGGRVAVGGAFGDAGGGGATPRGARAAAAAASGKKAAHAPTLDATGSLASLLSAGPTPATVSLTVSELGETLRVPAAGTVPGPGGLGTINRQAQTGGMHDAVKANVFSAVALRGEVLTRVLAYLGEARQLLV
jgi:hypothetical protein